VRTEIQRRKPRDFDPREVVRIILEQTRASVDGLTTYGEVWHAMTGGQPWKGNATQSKMGRELAHALAYCHQSGLPIVTVLVVGQSKRTLSDEAIDRICEECAELGLEIGPDRRAFVEKHARESKNVALADLPSG
jgi:hypothetical protein